VNDQEKSHHYDGDKHGRRADLALAFTFLVVLGVMGLVMLR
jgi:hypothetical protein